MQQNDISITVTPDTETAILAKLDEVAALIKSFARSLTPDQAAAYFKLGDGRLAFDEKCDNYMHQRTELVPDGVSLPEYDKDGAATDSVKRIRAKLATTDGLLSDTQIVLGSDRLDADLLFYAYLDFASRTGAPGAGDIHADLKTVYPGRSKSSTPQKPAAAKA
jgi:hypothetical protein